MDRVARMIWCRSGQTFDDFNFCISFHFISISSHSIIIIIVNVSVCVWMRSYYKFTLLRQWSDCKYIIIERRKVTVINHDNQTVAGLVSAFLVFTISVTVFFYLFSSSFLYWISFYHIPIQTMVLWSIRSFHFCNCGFW